MTDPIDTFLAGYPPAMRAISQRLRTLVIGAMPQASEVLYARHNHIGYSFNGKMSERILYICPMRAYVRLGFMYGGRLDDPVHLLEGVGKRLRHVKVRTLHEADSPALRQLVVTAWTNAQG